MSDTNRSASQRVGAALMTVLGVTAITAILVGCLRAPKDDSSANPAGDNTSKEAPAGRPGPALFQGWNKPEVVLVLSGEQHGFNGPCGCSDPQYGGLERRYNFIQSLKDRGWPVVAVDLGDIPQRKGPQSLPNVQGLPKYVLAMKALDKMGYTAVSFGEYEMALPLFDALGEYALNYKTPRVLAANLNAKDTNYPDQLFDMALADKYGGPKVGVVGVIGPSVAAAGRQHDPKTLVFEENLKVLPGVLKQLNGQKPDIRVLLYQGLMKDAKRAAGVFPQFQVVLCLSEQDEPSEKPEKVGDTLVIGVGHKGKYVGAVGVYKTGKPDRPFDLRYQLVLMSPDFKTPDDKSADHPIVKLLEDYTQSLRANNVLSKYASANKHSMQVAFPTAAFIGSEACKKCHETEYDIWKKTPHAHAYKTLENARKPSLREFDGECIICHTVGFTYKTGFVDAQHTPLLKNVGCESCHGPGSLHVAKPNDLQVQAAMNVWKALPGETEAKRVLRMQDACIKCHDIENDVHWKEFAPKWKLIAH